MSTSTYRFQEISQNFTPLASCQFKLDDGLVIEVTSDVLAQSIPISIGRITSIYYNGVRYYMFFMQEGTTESILSPVMPDYDPNMPYMGTLSVVPLKSYPAAGGTIGYVYMTTNLDSMLISFMNPCNVVQETSSDGSITATLVMIPEGTLLDSSMNIMKTIYPDAFAAYSALSNSTAGSTVSLSGDVSTFTFQDLGGGLGNDLSTFQFILDNTLVIPVTNAMLASPSIGIYYSSMIVYNNIRYFLFVNNNSSGSNILSPLVVDLDPSKPANSCLAPEAIGGYPAQGGSVSLLYRTLDAASISGGATQPVNLITNLPGGTSYSAPVVAIAEYVLADSSYQILESIYPELSESLQELEAITFSVNQTSPDPSSLDGNPVIAYRSNWNLLWFGLGALIAGGVIWFVWTKKYEGQEYSPAPAATAVHSNPAPAHVAAPVIQGVAVSTPGK